MKNIWLNVPADQKQLHNEWVFIMEYNIKEENQYCTSCGAVNKKSAVFCEECNKKIIVRHRPAVDFLKKRVKGRVVGEVTEKGFDLVKNFIFNHLYGLV